MSAALMPFTDRRLWYHVESEYHACTSTLGKLGTCLCDTMETVRDQLQHKGWSLQEHFLNVLCEALFQILKCCMRFDSSQFGDI